MKRCKSRSITLPSRTSSTSNNNYEFQQGVIVHVFIMVYQQIVGIPMGTKCAPLIADLFLYFVKEHSDSKNKYTEDDKVNMLEFLVDNIFVVFGGKVFQQIVGIPMGTNCAPLLADIFLYSYEAEFIQSLLSTGKKKLASQFNFTYRLHRWRIVNQ